MGCCQAWTTPRPTDQTATCARERSFNLVRMWRTCVSTVHSEITNDAAMERLVSPRAIRELGNLELASAQLGSSSVGSHRVGCSATHTGARTGSAAGCSA